MWQQIRVPHWSGAYDPEIPCAAWVLLFVVIMTMLNLLGIRATATTNVALLACMFVVIGAFIVLAIQHLFRFQGWHGLLSTHPFYDSRSFDLRSVATATSFAALTYIGFDGVTTFAEDVENPRRNVLLAVVLVCLFTALFGGFLPTWHSECGRKIGLTLVLKRRS